MQKQEHRVRENQRVKLKSDGQDALYAFACAGSEGWVRKLDHDKMGYPMVFIEWDKDHWAYNGEPDKWAMEAHFDKIEDTEKMADTPPEDFQQFMQSMYNAWKGSQQTPENETVDVEIVDESKVNGEAVFRKVVEKATEFLPTSDSFIVITVNREQPDGQDIPTLIPRVFNFYKTTEGGLLAEMQLSKLGAIAHEELSIEAIRQQLGADDES